jgi:1-acyl-sn-glycerol-3-phosphate acyltransferase
MWASRFFIGLRPIVGLYWRFRASGHLDELHRQRPLILVANHSCFLDPWFLMISLRQPISYMINARWYGKSTVWKWFFDGHDVIPMVEGSPKETLLAAARGLERGALVGIFPEGRITYDGLIQRFQPGAIQVAAHTGAPIIPVGVRGAFESIPRSKRFPRPGTIDVRVGAPIVFPDFPLAGPIPRHRLVECLDQVLLEVCRLAGQEDRFAVLRSGRGTASPQPESVSTP